MKISRRRARVIKIGNVYIGGKYPIAIQSMAKTETQDIEKTIKQIKKLENAGCEIIRVAVKNNRDAEAIKRIKQKIKIPLVADIHFDWRLALKAIDNGVDKIRLNPGNIYREREVREIVHALKSTKIPLRVGVNSGSIKNLNSKRLGMSDKLAASALNYVKMIEKLGFYNMVISLKASNALDTVEAYRRIARVCDYPLHLGVTATGSLRQGTIKSSIALGILLSEGIGDTIRISLTDKPEEEIKVAKAILEVLGLRRFGLEIVSCPTCGRCEVDLIKIVKEFEKKINAFNCKPLNVNLQPLKVAIMGCVVNGPGEATDADIGVAFGTKAGLLFKEGKPVKKISFDRCVDVLLRDILRSSYS